MIIFLLLMAGTYVGWNIGSNDAANCIGTTVGSGFVQYKKAIWLVAVSVLAGALFQGQYVMKALGKGVIQYELPLDAVFIAMLSAGILVTIATLFHMPVSTSQAIVGGLIGSGLAAFGIHSEAINILKLIAIVIGWIWGPFLSMAGALIFYIFLRFLLKWLRTFLSVKAVNRILILLVIFSAAYASFSLGANNAANAFGPILNLYPGMLRLCMLFGGLSLALGALTFGKRVTKTISKDIMPLDLSSAFAAQFSTAIVVHGFALLALPISTSQGIVGSIIGIGIANRIKTVSRRTIFKILLSWFLVPISSATLSYSVNFIWKML